MNDIIKKWTHFQKRGFVKFRIKGSKLYIDDETLNYYKNTRGNCDEEKNYSHSYNNS